MFLGVLFFRGVEGTEGIVSSNFFTSCLICDDEDGNVSCFCCVDDETTGREGGNLTLIAGERGDGMMRHKDTCLSKADFKNQKKCFYASNKTLK